MLETTVHNSEALAATMSKRDFSRLSGFIYTECGIKMPPAKKVMLEARLRKRLRSLGMASYGEYCDYLFSPVGIENELVHMLDMVTTNKTDFFRESTHFDYLVKQALPELISTHDAGMRRPVMVWSAGCSTGEEPYTLGMVMNEFSESVNVCRYMILATDISTKVLDIAKSGIYTEDKIGPVPPAMKKKYILRSKDRKKGLVRIIPELRERIKFRRLNFMDGDFGMREPIDVIFCRNVIIYFDRDTQETLMNRFCKHMRLGGYLFLGHSETLFGMDVPLTQVAPTIYRKTK